MRRFSLAALFAFAAISAVWLAGLAAQIGAPSQMSRWIYEAAEIKRHRAAVTPSPRILIVAGSNALFGLDARQLGEAWNRPVVNMAVNAGLGLRYILWQAKDIARPGDTILLPLEYSLYVDDDRPNAQIVDYAVARDPAYWHSLPLWRKLQFAAAMAADRWWRGLHPPIDLPVAAGPYGGYHIDDWGDQTHTSPEDQSPADRAAVAAAKVWDYGRRDDPKRGGWPLLAEFAAWARGRDVCLVALPPALLSHPQYTQEPAERGFYQSLPVRMAAIGIPFLGQPLDFMYPEDWFFNTDYHLLDWARSAHTARVAALLGPPPFAACGGHMLPRQAGRTRISGILLG
jgi:hypothetical protein